MLPSDPASIDLTPKPSARAKSPPLAFERTPNDMLISPPRTLSSTEQGVASPSASIMGRLSPRLSPGEASEEHLQVIVDQQANAIQLLHEAFAAERQVWCLEKERLYQRIANLEKLLKSGDHYSPAKSPIISPSWGSGLASPQPRSLVATHLLPTIKEDDKPPLSERREGAPRSIDLPSLSGSSQDERRSSAVSFAGSGAARVEEIPGRSHALSPPPANNRVLAGHTPVRIPRKLTPPPQKMSIAGIEDTPTRNNTHINTYLTRSNDDDEEKALQGPLNMPELPHEPSAANFTLEALSRRLEQIEKNPDESKPMIFAQPSPGLASPENERSDQISPHTKARNSEGTLAPMSTRDGNIPLASGPASETSPSITAMSPNGAPLTPLDPHTTEKFEHGGIRLKKKTSVNFGAPFGQLGGYGSIRKLS